MLCVCCLHVTHKLISVATLTYIDQEFSKIFVYVFVDLKDRVKDGKRELPYDSSAPQVAAGVRAGPASSREPWYTVRVPSRSVHALGSSAAAFEGILQKAETQQHSEPE